MVKQPPHFIVLLILHVRYILHLLLCLSITPLFVTSQTNQPTNQSNRSANQTNKNCHFIVVLIVLSFSLCLHLSTNHLGLSIGHIHNPTIRPTASFHHLQHGGFQGGFQGGIITMMFLNITLTLLMSDTSCLLSLACISPPTDRMLNFRTVKLSFSSVHMWLGGLFTM